jgi:hypothetical protein
MWMAEQADRMRWNHTFAVCAQLHNAFRDSKKSDAIPVNELCPWVLGGSKRQPKPASDADRRFLEQAFPKR